VTEEGQRDAKRRAVADALRRIGGFDALSVPPVLFAGPALGYRRRARLQVGWPGGKLRLGYHAPGSRAVVDVPVCAQMSTGLAAAYGILREALGAAPALAGLESVELAVGSADGPGVAAFRLQNRAPRETRQSIRSLAPGLVQSKGLAGAAILTGGGGGGDRIIARWGDIRVAHDTPAGSLPGAPFTLRQLGWSFTQASFEANLLLVRTVMAALGEPAPERVLELYAGSGNFTLPLAALGIRMEAVEGNVLAARDLSDNLARAGRQAKVVAAPAKVALARAGGADAVLLDPPRSGAAALIPALAQRAPSRIVYVSCDPATLARDLRQLAARGYRIDSLRALDLSPQTYHVECVATCLLEKRP
ncbi:MAG: class I SAM-dependent RNA methyltransferase, partial [Myxococcota bacterium]